MTDVEKRAKEWVKENCCDFCMCSSECAMGNIDCNGKDGYIAGATEETKLLSEHILKLQKDKGKLIDENKDLQKRLDSLQGFLDKDVEYDEYKKLKLATECCHCVYSDSPCVPSDYSKDENGHCSHYKSVFEENRQLKNDYEMIDNCNRVHGNELANARKIIKSLIPYAFDLSEQLSDDKLEIYRQAEKFLRETK